MTPVLRYWAGMRVSDDSEVLLGPSTDGDFVLENTPVLGYELTFSRCGDHLRVVDIGRTLIAKACAPSLSFALPQARAM